MWHWGEIMDIYEKTMELTEGSCDCFNRLKLSRLFLHMQDAAASHAELLGFKREMLLGEGMVFVLARVSINILKMPPGGSEIKLKTYPKGMDKLFFIRDFEISCKGEAFAHARTLWLLMDVGSRRPAKIRDSLKALVENHKSEERLEIPPRLEKLENPDIVNKIKIGYSHIDSNGHVNNTMYIDWISDALGAGFFRDNIKYALDVNYISEAVAGMEVEICKEENRIEGRAMDKTVFLSAVREESSHV
jgi:medium-chain acyl-[acyl-carrier-protein] hydrolase